MARIVLIASGITSPLMSQLALAQRLSARGHQICFIAPETSKHLIVYAGFDFCAIQTPSITTFNPLLPHPNGLDRMRPGCRKNRALEALNSLDLFVLKDHLKSVRPDIVMIDCELHAHIIVSLGLRLRVVLTTNMFLSRPSFKAPPLHYRQVPGSGVMGSPIGVAAQWVYYLARKFAVIGKNAVIDWGADHPSALLVLARQEGVNLPTLLRLLCWQMPWAYNLPTLIMLPRALDLPTKASAELHYVGPMILEDRPVPKTSTPPPKAIGENRRSPMSRRIYAAFGTILSPDNDFIAALWEVMRRHPDWQLMIVVGEHWQSKPIHNPPENVEVFGWVQQHKILESADLAIMHGGTGGLVEAVDTATPILAYPYVIDEFGNATRVVIHGVGRSGKPSDQANQIETDIQSIFSDTRFRSSVNEMQKLCRKETEAEIAENFVDALLGQHANK
ncbi:MAG: glycosyltransferase [Marinosulfonomonas sp.]